MTTAYLAVLAGGLAVLVASLARDIRWLRGALAGGGLLAAWGAHARGLDIAAGIVLAVALANLAQLALAHNGRRRVRLSPEEARLAQAVLPRMDPATLRRLLDQGLWIDALAGETLIREGQPAPHLFYLAEGAAEVTTAGHAVARCTPGHFLGEITILSGQPATATVTCSGRARFWCIGRDALNRMLAADPDIRPLLEAAFVGDMAEKLRLANARLAAG